MAAKDKGPPAAQTPLVDPSDPRAVRSAIGKLGAMATSMTSTGQLAMMRGDNRLAAVMFRGAAALADIRVELEPLAESEAAAARDRQLSAIGGGKCRKDDN